MKIGLNGYIALLRGINVGGNNAIAMPELCDACGELGWTDVHNYIQSGNVVFASAKSAPVLEADLEQAIKLRFKLSIPVIVRSAADWAGYLKRNPFPDASRSEPKSVMLAISKRPPKPDAAELLRQRGANGESLVQVGDVLWIHFSRGVARSKLAPSLLDRWVGSPVTTRNWRTVVKLGELVEGLNLERL